MRNFFSLTFAPALIGAALLTVPSECLAQAPAPNAPEAPSATPDQKPPANGGPLSKKLDKNEGVLTPPGGVDPKIHKEPPADTGDRMPMIVPPGEPGGNQNIQPK
ncbi:hypothetical protein HYPDE_31833 [Hyphomicrobium denitrificans 1NES1]|uniref:Uncharacterized protein n=1 Tax=Hyphomicrobium denitrificans 1NES1 TaxID=670307 RepID=N0BC16_9HYPH|nr:hypothetical protein [Hyphomicrobium denitrificans]AGK58041.1 hypothetical protein HYPDE_31833 [Hyphomicrobium denitrificans 1NES1]